MASNGSKKSDARSPHPVWAVFGWAALRRLLLGGGPTRFGALDALFFCAATASNVGFHHRYNCESAIRLQGESQRIDSRPDCHRRVAALQLN